VDYGVSRALNYHRLKQLLLTSTLHEFFSQNHLFLEGQNRPIPAPWNQAFTAHDSGRLLERPCSARQAVPTPMPSCSETTRHEVPAAHRVATCSGFTAARTWTPNRFPFDLASRSAAFTRSVPATEPNPTSGRNHSPLGWCVEVEDAPRTQAGKRVQLRSARAVTAYLSDRPN
jgi:hypothetical protein